MKIRYIAIEREYGSGGTQIAQLTAQQCGIGCYGREIMEQVADQQEVSVKALEEYEERVTGSLFYSMFVLSQSQTGDPDLVSQEAKLYVAETRVIRQLAKAGPAVFVGHSAAQVLEKDGGVLRVFIHGSETDKHRRAVEEYGIAPDQAEATCRKFNRRRASYYNFCTHKKWSDRNNYDMVLDSSTLGIEGCVRAICALYQLDKPEMP